MQLLGIDNVFFEVADLTAALAFYQKLGFVLKFSIPRIPAALFAIGTETPGLMLTQKEHPVPTRLWVEVTDAHAAQEECVQLGIAGVMKEAATGFTLEVTDPWRNVIGFADYTKKPELGR